MSRGFSLPETALVVALAGLLLLVGAPRLATWMDRAAVAAASRETVTAIAVARHQAIALGSRTRVRLGPDSLVIDTLGLPEWGRWNVFPGARAHGVAFRVTNPAITFTPIGIASGASNTRVDLSRGSHRATITVSRVGRVKSW